MRTCIDSGLQRLMERAVAGSRHGGRYGLNNAAALLIHWPSMEIRGPVGPVFLTPPYPDRWTEPVPGVRPARRSSLIYGMALDQGLIHPQTLLPDSRAVLAAMTQRISTAFRGPLPAHEACAPAVTARDSVGLAAAPGFLWLAARRVDLPFSADHYGLSLVLGGAEVSMRELGGLYAMLANKGVWRHPRLYEGEAAGSAVPLLSPEAAVVTLRMLEDDAHFVRSKEGPVPLRFKTGTSNGFRDAWTAGVVGPYVLVVWVGNFDNTPNPLLVGGDVAAPLFTDIAQALASDAGPLDDLVPVQQECLDITRETVCTATGDLDVSLCGDTTETWYIPGRSPTRSSGVFRTILIDAEPGCACRPVRADRGARMGILAFDLQALFLRAGVVKPPPPPFECGPEAGVQPGRPPGSSPEGRSVSRRLSDPNGAAFRSLRARMRTPAPCSFVKIGLSGVRTRRAVGLAPGDGAQMLRVVDNLGGRPCRRFWSDSAVGQMCVEGIWSR
ncbi:MAG: hypothetical protein ACLRWP_20975 [Bilophila wadsworthia]